MAKNFRKYSKAAKKEYSKDGIVFKSKEEYEFYLWIKIAEEHGLIKDPVYQPAPYILSERLGVEVVENYQIKIKPLFPKIEYTADWSFFVTEKFESWFPGLLIYDDNKFCVVDVKGLGGLYGNTSYYTFPIKRAWLYRRTRIYVNKIVGRPKKASKSGNITDLGFFLKTFVPEEIIWIKGRTVPTKAKDFNNIKLKTIHDLEEFYKNN